MAHRHTDPAADIGRARAPCRSERWAARAEGTGGQAGAGFEGRPALRATEWAPRQPDPDPGTFARTIMVRSRSVVLCGRREPRHLWWRASSAPATSSLPGRPPLCDWWRTGSLSWASLQERGQSPIPAVVSTLERPARSVPGRVVQAVDGVRSVQQWARP
ncbi:hypothetical protein KXW89_007698 [Aspergillus fumigatus]|nr:hypothetical protein KXW89_007698 [Aspergillus fumigatus]